MLLSVVSVISSKKSLLFAMGNVGIWLLWMKVNMMAERGVWSADLACDQQQILFAGFSHTSPRWNASMLPAAISSDHPKPSDAKRFRRNWRANVDSSLHEVRCPWNAVSVRLPYFNISLCRKPTRNAGGSEIKIVWCTFCASSYNVCLLRAKVSVLVAKVKPGAVACFPAGLTDLISLLQRKRAGQYVICERDSG